MVLRRGKNASYALWAWHDALASGDSASARKSCSLVMYSVDGKPVARYHLENAWPSKIDGRSPTVTSAAGQVDSVTLVCDEVLPVALDA